MVRYRLLCFSAALALAAAPVAPASATNVTFTGLVVNACVLTLSTPGLLGTSADGTQLSSEESGGTAAILAVVSTGSTPSLSFSAPTLSGPPGWTGSPIVSVKMSALSGATQAWTASSFTTRLSQLLDTLTINGRAVNSGGFASGSYTLATTVTCQQ